MRTIKFRAWDVNLKKMSKSETLESIMTGVENFNPYGTLEIMQFTGLLDKNGVEIYEGDILCWSKDENKTKRMTWFVEWTGRGWSQWSSTHDEAIIIGNIYENPELLENTK